MICSAHVTRGPTGLLFGFARHGRSAERATRDRPHALHTLYGRTGMGRVGFVLSLLCRCD